MSKQLHNRLSKEQVEAILLQCKLKEIKARDACAKLGVGKTRFSQIYSRYLADDATFDFTAKRSNGHRRISKKAEKKIVKELKTEKELIENKDMPICTYNYSAIRDTLKEKYGITVSVPTIITRAKAGGYYIEKKERRVHDRIVLTDFTGELVQHDSSNHLWSPFMDEKLYLITSIDDYSRLLLFADFFTRETTWNHIMALQSVFTTYGCPLKYYADQHSIFRYVKNRDQESNWVNYTKFTDDVDTQWRAVLRRCNVEPIYALSPQAKGKVERPYRWMQDRVVRTATKEKLTTIDELRDVLTQLVHKYNNEWVHSTTKEIPVVRFEKALNNNLCLFKPLQSVKPDTDLGDIFCIAVERKVDGYRQISFDSKVFDIPNARPRQPISINISFDVVEGLAEFRFWQNGILVERKTVKISDLKSVHF
jgi:hypothetical protein